jgi:hypothetical protein
VAADGASYEYPLDRLIELARDAGRFFGRDMAGTIWKTGPVPTMPAGAHDLHRQRERIMKIHDGRSST